MTNLTKTEVDKLEIPTRAKNRNGELVETQRVYRDSQLKGFAVRVTSNGYKAYIVERKIGGKTFRRTIGATNVIPNKEARVEAQKILAELSQGKDRLAAKADKKQKQISLSQVLEDYIAKRELKPRTIAIYRNVLDRYLSDWQMMPIADLTREMVEKRLEQIANTNGPRGQGRAMSGQTYRLLRSLVRFSQSEHEVNGKPVIELDPTRNLSTARAWTKSVRREGLLEKHQIREWFEALNQVKNETVRDFLLFTLLTGLRRQEALALKWSEVSIAGRHIRISGDRTKNGKEHGLPLSDYLIDMLKKRRQFIGSEYVFPGRDITKPLQEPKRALELITKISGIKLMVHDLRRTFITYAESLDVPAYALKKLVNHSTKNDVTAGYVIGEIERLRQPMQRITDHFLDLANSSKTKEQSKG